jgi:hypothetical protein
MNPQVTSVTDMILKHTDPAFRDQVAQVLSTCNFTSPDDPMLGGLAVQALLASQPVRLAESGGAAVATESGLARLGDRFDEVASTLLHLKIRNILLSWLVCFSMGAGSLLACLMIWPQSTADFLRLPKAPDARLRLIDQTGASLRVSKDGEAVVVYFAGETQPAAGQTKDGRNYLYFGRQ